MRARTAPARATKAAAEASGKAGGKKNKGGGDSGAATAAGGLGMFRAVKGGAALDSHARRWVETFGKQGGRGLVDLTNLLLCASGATENLVGPREAIGEFDEAEWADLMARTQASLEADNRGPTDVKYPIAGTNKDAVRVGSSNSLPPPL